MRPGDCAAAVNDPMLTMVSGHYKFKKIYDVHGIRRFFSVSWSPQQNKVVERKNGYILNMVKAY